MKLNSLTSIALGACLSIASSGFAQTTETAPHVFRIESGVDFTINNLGASSFLFNWTDSSGSVVDEEDPTLVLTAGEVYTFRRLTGSHPFVITDTTLPISGSDGSFQRETTDGAVIDASTLGPIADFTADPSPSEDMIVWTLMGEDVGEYYYTCRIVFHVGMAGAIRVVPAPCLADINGDTQLDFLDISEFLSAYNQQNSVADLNKDDQYDFLDISAFLGSYSAGCP